jgi:FAD/FMN-containing dehydrogenase
MNPIGRRRFLTGAAAATALAACSRPGGGSAGPPATRVRPGQPGWPSPAVWAKLRDDVGGRLIELHSPFDVCRTPSPHAECDKLFAELKDPYYVGNHPELTQESGLFDAWTSTPSAYAVAAQRSADVVAGVNFAREHNLRLVIKGGGHSYQGTSNAPDSLLIWPHAMNDIALHDAFTPASCPGPPQPAVSVGAGATWADAYDAVTTRAGRYVQGGRCVTVGVAGLIQSGGFGAYSKNYGVAAAGLLEAELVTADGTVRIANACTNPDLFWALKGGGGGTFGVVTRMTLRTYDLPDYFGDVTGTIKAHSDNAFHALVARTVSFYQQSLFNPNWGETITLSSDNTVRFGMGMQGLTSQQANDVWRPFLDWVAGAPQDYSYDAPFAIDVYPARKKWDAARLRPNSADTIGRNDRPSAPAGNISWTSAPVQAGWFFYGYRTTWLPASLLSGDQQGALVDSLVAASRHSAFELHLQKGLANSPEAVRSQARDTAVNPVVADAFALVIVAQAGEAAFPGVPGHEPDYGAGRRGADAVNQAMAELLKVAPQAGAYVSESDFFQPQWQQSFWGPNYARLAAIKQQYDPGGLFFVHHGVGSEQWTEDGFARVQH